MHLVKEISEWIEFRGSREFESKSLGFVPTMGAIHKGHLSLVERSVGENDITAVSIFLNPTQFNNKNDLDKYPVNFNKDIELLDGAGVDYVFAPVFNDIYPDNYKYKVVENDLSTKLCGASRPGHFDGVLSIVMKLLNIIEADRAYFGEKDYQQYLLIKGMVEAYFMKTEIIPCSIIRAEDGLALSSRNERLTVEERKRAPEFYKILNSGNNLEQIKNELTEKGFKVDYVEDVGNRRFGAVFLGEIRLIDNVEIKIN